MTQPDDQTAMLQALDSLLRPLASLAVSQGVTHAAVDELLRQAFVDAAREAHMTAGGTPNISRISTTTGLNRREVTRLVTRDSQPLLPTQHRWPAGEVFTRWMTLTSTDATLYSLPRQGPAPSFEALAHEVTRDIHPRSLLDELVRLGLAKLSTHGDFVIRLRDTLVPQGDFVRTLGFLGDNVGDHLRAAAANAIGQGNEHFEQALYADELSTESVIALRPFITRQWQTLFDQLVPVLEQMIAEDKQSGRCRDQRVRIGLFAFSDHCGEVTDPAGNTREMP